ncbi:glycosyltransferase [Actinomadura bangladeshensis]|uniref:Glycosyltransferase n=1 Tax=Actinomadura bangladeshensis TaxID=453573 RepID=A0A6L9Q9N5_9ACTN|nr:glycosyltransferase [Actinomadura bangladeshensis]
MTPPNPFRDAGRPATGERYIERPALQEGVGALWRDPGRPGNLSVFGQRGVGKTSLVEHSLAAMDRTDLVVARLDVGRMASVFDLFGTLTRRVARCLPDIPGLADLAETARRATDWADLDEAVSVFFEAVGDAGRYVLLVLDQFDRAPLVLAELSGYQLLRALASEARYPVGLVTISRRPVQEIEIDAAGGSRLQGVIGRRCDVGLFALSETARMLERASEAGLDLSADAAEILDLTGTHPLLLESLCDRIVRHYQRTGKVNVGVAYSAGAADLHAYFSRLTGAIDQDARGRGGDLLRAIAGGTALDETPELQELVRTGIVVRNGSDHRLFSAAFARSLLEQGSAPSADRPDPDEHCRVLVVATEWGSAHGGLSTFNRQLCQALAAHGAQVFCLVVSATQAEKDKAEAHGVTLLTRDRLADTPEEMGLFLRPELPGRVRPNLVIGHARITGAAALVQAQDNFESATRLHFVHMAPDEIEWHKLRDDAANSAEARTRNEVFLGRQADRLVAVGPRLHGRFQGYLSRPDDREPLRFDPGFDIADPRPRKVPGGVPLSVLLVGRAEEYRLKGLDLAAKACGLVAERRDRQRLDRIELVVRGVPEHNAAAQREQLQNWADNPRLTITPRLYTTDTERLSDDLYRASVVIMPSRNEGFGLVGIEAIVTGTPVLLSENSGLAELLRERLGEERAATWVVPMSGRDDEDAANWANAIERVLLGRERHFEDAEKLRAELARELPWSRSVETLLAALGF